MEALPIFKKIMIILLILLSVLLAAATASAAENVTGTEKMDEIAEKPLGAVDETRPDTLESVGADDDFRLDIRNTNVKVGDPHINLEDIATLHCPEGVSGNLSVWVGDDVIRTYELGGNASTILLDYGALKLPFGRSTMKIAFANETSSRQLYSGRINVDYYMEICCGRSYGDGRGTDYPLFYDTAWTYHVDVPRDADGKLFVSFDGNAYEPASYNRRGTYSRTTSVKGLAIGAHTITARLQNDSRYPDKTVSYTFYVTPEITVPEAMAVGEREFIIIHLPDDYRGTARIFLGDVVHEDIVGEYYVKGSLIASAEANGDVRILIPAVNIGENAIYVNLTGSGDYEDYFYMDCYQNDPRFSATLSSDVIEKGSKITLTVNTPKSDTNLYVYVDGVEYDSMDICDGHERMAISGLAVGQHHIKLEYCLDSYDRNGQRVVERFYSNSFYVTVKEKTAAKKSSKAALKTTLTLKEVKVKRSLKKLTIQVILKKGSKALSGKTVTFKFKAKKYTAKTNRKGVAKVTLKRSILKKLKVGETVRYQAIYGKICVKKSVKVKR